MAPASKHTDPEVERRRAAAGRMRGLFEGVAPDRSLVDELIADRRAEVQAGRRERNASTGGACSRDSARHRSNESLHVPENRSLRGATKTLGRL